LAAIFFLVFGVAAYGSLIRKQEPPGTRQSKSASHTKKVRLGGHARGLYPGRVGPLRVHLDNLGQRPQIVGSVWATVGNAGPRCSARNISVSAYRGRLRIPPRGRRWISLTIAMRPNAANTCQLAVFPLTFHAGAGH
jgi:hypothetical protein